MCNCFDFGSKNRAGWVIANSCDRSFRRSRIAWRTGAFFGVNVPCIKCCSEGGGGVIGVVDDEDEEEADEEDDDDAEGFGGSAGIANPGIRNKDVTLGIPARLQYS